MHHRAQVSDAALNRYYLRALHLDDTSTLEELTAQVERRVRWKGRSVRAIHPFDPGRLHLTQSRPIAEFNITGFRNRDLPSLLYPTPPKPALSNASVPLRSAESCVCSALTA